MYATQLRIIVPISKGTQTVPINKNKHLKLFREAITVHSIYETQICGPNKDF